MGLEQDLIFSLEADAYARENMDPELRRILEEYDRKLEFAAVAQGALELPTESVEAILNGIPRAKEATAAYQAHFDGYKAMSQKTKGKVQ